METAEDIIEELGMFVAAPSLQIPPESPYCKEGRGVLSVEHRQLLDQIEYEITPMDVIVLRSGLTAGELSSILLILELNGYIQSVPGGYVREVLDQ